MSVTSQTEALVRAHDPYARPVEEVLADLESKPQGLSVSAAEKRLVVYGPPGPGLPASGGGIRSTRCGRWSGCSLADGSCRRTCESVPGRSHAPRNCCQRDDRHDKRRHR
ncbi:hypothetical protein E3T43_11490 [Cryobacterium sp. Hh7]|uniref:cation-transporting P-type ATPase n=1 Tax=Cryobacterium sp. Hh7 TaxID=1259159 RepID=UPI00106D5699|nr:hypothetical protein E3T43_11490 [Cryobacterium sp. Hh7]